MLPVIPLLETDYFVEESVEPLVNSFIFTKTNKELTSIEFPNYYPDNNQCLDFWFQSAEGKHLLTVNNFTMTIKNKSESEIPKLKSYLFWDMEVKMKNSVLKNTKLSERIRTSIINMYSSEPF
jgi:hypothetical protein